MFERGGKVIVLICDYTLATEGLELGVMAKRGDLMGAVGGIGGTYGAMPQLYVELYRCVKAGELAKALEIQNDCCRIIYKLCSGHGNMYGMIKEILRRNAGPDLGKVRAPLADLIESDYAIADECVAMIRAAVAKYC